VSLRQLQLLPCAKCGDERLHGPLGCVTCGTSHPSQVTKITNEAWMRSFCESAERAKHKRMRSYRPAMTAEQKLAKRRAKRALLTAEERTAHYLKQNASRAARGVKRPTRVTA